MTGRPRIAVLLMAYGGPDSLEDVEPFLLDVRGGRPTPQALISEVRARYRAIGGRSPLLSITRAQAAALQETLDATDPGRFRVHVGMRHWRPTIAEAVAEIARAGTGRGAERIVGLPLAPQVSGMSVGAYVRALEDAVERVGRKEAAAAGAAPPEVVPVAGFHDHPGFLDAWADRVRDGLARFPDPASVELLFTAHSLPESIVAEGDPYPEQVAATARRVAELVGRPGDGPAAGWRVAYQSAGARAVPWLGPSLEESLEELAGEAGRREVLVVPIGFVADHVEVLYDVDVEARELAERLDLRLERTESLNTHPGFVAALADLVRAAAPG